MKGVDFQYTEEHLIAIRNQPHLLGHIAGKSKLTELHSAWILYIWDTLQNRALQAHRGSYKTTAIAAIGAVWWMLFNPDDRICIMRKTFTDAADVVREIEMIMRLPEIQALFYFAQGTKPRFVQAKYGKLEFNFKTTNTPEGNVNAHAFDFSITGKHYDRILSDDFVTLRDRISKAERVRTKEVIKEIQTNIIEPGKPVSYIGTPWHRNDGWSTEGMPEPVRFDVNRCGILSPEDIEAKRSRTTPVLFSANYLLRHDNDTDMLFTDPTYGEWKYSASSKIYAQIDAAFDGDHTCALTIMAKRPDGKIQAVGFSYPGNVKDWIGFIRKKYKHYRAIKIFNETNPDKGYTADKMTAAGMKVDTYAESANKHIKISSVLYEAWPDIIWSNDTDDEYMEQIVDYREGEEPDDAPDSAASLIKKAGFVSLKAKNKESLWAL